MTDPIDIIGIFIDQAGTPVEGLSLFVSLQAQSAFLTTGAQVSVKEKEYVTDETGQVVLTLIPSAGFDRARSDLLDCVATYRIRIPGLGITRIVAVPTTLSSGTTTLDDLIDGRELIEQTDEELEELGLL